MKSKNYFQKSIATFKQWSRKPFAVFKSLNSVVKICVVTTAISLISPVEKVTAQQDTIKINNHLDIDEVVVSSNRSPQLYSEAARVVSVIGKEDLQQAPAQTLQEMLEFAMSVDVRQRGAKGVQADISIRGGSFEQTLILLNGIPVNNPQTGHHNLNIPLDFESIERIEILHGSGARVFGPNAFTGAINIVTSQATAKNLSLSLSAGMHNLYNASAQLNYNLGKLRNFVSVAANGSDGFTHNTDFKALSAFYSGAFTHGNNTFEGQFGYLNKAFGSNSFYTATYPDQFEEIENLIGSIGHNYANEKLSIKTKLYSKQDYDRFELFREDFYPYSNGFYISKENPKDTAHYAGITYKYPGHNYHLSTTNGITNTTSYRSKFGVSSIGFDFREESILSSNLGKKLTESIDVEREPRGKYNKIDFRQHFNAYIEHQYSSNLLSFSTGILAHNNSAYGWFFAPGAELGIKYAPQQKVFASVSRSMRMPTFTDLYYNGPTNVGNPELKPEYSMNYELGAKGKVRTINYTSSIFYRNIFDAIDWVKYPSEDKYTTNNYTQLNTLGFEIGLSYQPTNGLLKKIVNKAEMNFSYLNTDKQTQDSMQSFYALDYIKYKINMRADHRIYKGLGLSWQLSHQKRNGSYVLFNKTHNYKPVTYLDIKLYYKTSRFTLFTEATNIFNQEYYDLGGVPQPGTWISGGAKFNISLK
jgi:iron complex outermembrane receptor protein